MGGARLTRLTCLALLARWARLTRLTLLVGTSGRCPLDLFDLLCGKWAVPVEPFGPLDPFVEVGGSSGVKWAAHMVGSNESSG